MSLLGAQHSLLFLFWTLAFTLQPQAMHCCRSLITKRKLGLVGRYVSLGISMLGDHHAGELVNEEPQKLLWKFCWQGFMIHCYSRVSRQQDYCHLGPDNLLWDCVHTVSCLLIDLPSFTHYVAAVPQFWWPNTSLGLCVLLPKDSITQLAKEKQLHSQTLQFI